MDIWIEEHSFFGPNNISINQLERDDLVELAAALNVADYSIPTIRMQELRKVIVSFLNNTTLEKG